MNWWGKILGGTFGFVMGGPLGALLGTALGSYFDTGLKNVQSGTGFGKGSVERVQSVFFTTTFVVMGHIAKLDGRVTSNEISMVEQVMRQMQLDQKQRELAKNLFRQGKSEAFPISEVLLQFKAECLGRRNLIQMFMEIITATAFADGELSNEEELVLTGIAKELGFSAHQFRQLIARLAGQMNFVSPQNKAQKISAAYDLLSISQGASEQEIKKAYRRQMNQHHPDKLVAKGLPEEMIDLATEKTQKIKEAYELIMETR